MTGSFALVRKHTRRLLLCGVTSDAARARRSAARALLDTLSGGLPNAKWDDFEGGESSGFCVIATALISRAESRLAPYMGRMAAHAIVLERAKARYSCSAAGVSRGIR